MISSSSESKFAFGASSLSALAEAFLDDLLPSRSLSVSVSESELASSAAKLLGLGSGTMGSRFTGCFIAPVNLIMGVFYFSFFDFFLSRFLCFLLALVEACSFEGGVLLEIGAARLSLSGSPTLPSQYVSSFSSFKGSGLSALRV